MNRRGFFGRIGTLIAGAFAAKIAAPQFKSKMWFARCGSVPKRFSPPTLFDAPQSEVQIFDSEWNLLCDEYAKTHPEQVRYATISRVVDRHAEYWYSDAK